jgi:hypothetical protein
MTRPEGAILNKHVVIYDGSDGRHKPMEMECVRCGATLQPRLPLPVDQFVWICQGFEKQHRQCVGLTP